MFLWVKMMKSGEIKQDSRNYRQHNDKNKELMKKSLEECGTGRSIVIDSQNEIIAGNGIFEQVKKLKIPIKVIESDGTFLIAIKRTDLKTKDKKRKKLAVYDNSSSDLSIFNLDLLEKDFSKEVLLSLGIDVPEINTEGILEEDSFTHKFEEEIGDGFTVTFVFDKSFQELILKKIKDLGKEKVTKIVQEAILDA